jgi:LAO/AO transport system kinase
MPSDSHAGPRKYKKKKRELFYFLEGIRQGNRFVLAEAITLAESQLAEDQSLAVQLLLSLSGEDTGKSIRVAVTGSPGAGKSTFIDYLGMFWVAQGYKVAVLSVDPSSALSSGSILGDKTRMEALSAEENAFIRPTASGQQLGGISSRTREAILLCEAAGFDRVIIETVGVGQNEVEVSTLTDINLFILQPGAGDDLQGIKRGVLEKADICIVNKADGHLLEAARETALQYSRSLPYFLHPMSGWHIPVHKISSAEKEGLPAVILSLEKFIRQSQESGFFEENRRRQEISWFEKRAYDSVLSWAKQFPPLQKLLNDTKEKIRAGDEDAIRGTKGIITWLDTIQTREENV